MKRILVFLIVALLLLLASSCVDKAKPEKGTIISIEAEAEGMFYKEVTYDWTVEKTVWPEVVEAVIGQSAVAQYTIAFERYLAKETVFFSVQGEVCIYNEGGQNTENLTIIYQVQYLEDGLFIDLPGASAKIVSPEQLPAGQSQCYDYKISFSPEDSSDYRLVISVSITNYLDHAGEEFGPVLELEFDLPVEPIISYINESAVIQDIAASPEEFDYTVKEEGPWEVNESGSIIFRKRFINLSACGGVYGLSNTAYLTKNTTEETITSSAVLYIETGECP